MNTRTHWGFYTSRSRYHGQIILFQATEHPEDMPITEPDYGWGESATEGVEIVHVPGHHPQPFSL
ncbi:MAG: hypothetical protein GY801_53125 [bacterium]|nr:hypothetical protein [bacterium]